MKMIDRRELLRWTVAGAGAALCPPAATVLAQTPSARISATPLRGGLARLDGAGGNILVFENSEGLALVDSGASERGEAVKRYLEEMHAGAPVRVLFNTHWHPEHTGGNEAVASGDVPIVAHENTRLWMSTRFYVDWRERTYHPRPESARPTLTFHTSDPQPIAVDFGGRLIEYGHLRQAHTDGDIYVRFPDLNVIAAGGAVTAKTYPILDYITGGWIGALADATDELIELSDTDTLIVPDTGPVQTRADLEAQSEMLRTIRERIEELAIQGRSPAEMVAAGITSDFDDRWAGNRDLFVSNAYSGLWWSRMRGVIA